MTAYDNYALLTGSSAYLVVARSGSAIPGGGGAFEPVAGDAVGPFRGAARLDDGGDIAYLGAFATKVPSLYSSTMGIFARGAVVALNGDASPDYTGRTFVFDPDVSNPPSLGPDGTVAFACSLVGDGFDWVNHDVGLYAQVPGAALKPVVHRGDAIPGGGAHFQAATAEDWLGFGPVELNVHRAIAFGAFAKLDTTQTGPYGNGAVDGIYVYSPTTATRIMLASDPAPDGNGTLIDIYDVKHAPALNDAGQVAFLASAHGDDLVLVGGTGPLAIAARAGQSAPGDGVYAQLRWQPSLNAGGDIVFIAATRIGLYTTETPVQALFVGQPGALTRAVRTGDVPPEGNGVFTALASSSIYTQVNGHRPNINDTGAVAFAAEITNATGSHDLGLYVYNGTQLHKVVRTGDVLDGKSVADIGFQSVASSGVRGLNASCQIAYVVRYTDDSYDVWLNDGCAP